MVLASKAGITYSMKNGQKPLCRMNCVLVSLVTNNEVSGVNTLSIHVPV